MSLRMSNAQSDGEATDMSEDVYGVRTAGRVTHGLLRLGTAMRGHAWEWAEGAKLTPTQGEILVLLMQRKATMRLGEIARETALTAATTSDAVSTLEEKGLVEKRRAISPSRIGPLRCISKTRISPWVGVSFAPSAHSHAWPRIAVPSRSRPCVTRPAACTP